MPDLNSVPPSPHALAASRRASSQQLMGAPPPPNPSSPSLNILPSNQSAVSASATGLPAVGTGMAPLASPHLHGTAPPTSMAGNNSAATAMGMSLPTTPARPEHHYHAPPPPDNTGVGPGPGPLRHPRPLTAADLHLQLEKEQEAVVNRLTRELSLLRAAQNASVVSNASSTSASGAPDTGNAATTSLPGFLPGTAADPPYSMGSSGFMIQYPNAGSGPVPPRRHHRTGSNASARSVASSTFANTGSANTGIPSSRGGSVAQTGGNTAMGGVSLSRQNSSASTRARTSRAASPSPHLMPSDPATIPGYFYAYGPREPPQQSQRSSSQQQQPHQYYSGAAAAHHPQTPSTAGGQHPSEPILSPGLVPATSRYEETALHRMELEAVRRENEALRRRVRELERRLRERRASDASVASSVSVSASGMTPSASGVSGAAIAGNSTGTPGAGSGGVGGSITAPRAGRERAAGITGSSPPSAGLPPGSNAFPSGSTASPVAAAVSTAGPAAVHAGSAVFVPSVGHVIPTSVATGSAPPAAAATATASPVASTPGLPSVPSTTSLAVGVPDDEVQVGESAASAGLGLGGTPTGGDNKSAPEQDGRSQQQQQSHHPVSSSGGVADVGS